VAYVRVADPRRSLALAAARLAGPQPGTVVAVTGTSGKSSVADFVRQLYAALGLRAASLGTLGVITSEGAAYGSLTTPDPISLHETLARLAHEGTTHVAMEASSHGIDQRRLDGVVLRAGAFTNLGRDHLDYHSTTEAYAAAKLRLFDTLLPDDAPAVINADGPFADVFLEGVSRRGLAVMTTGRAGRTLRLVESRPAGFNQRLTIAAFGRSYEADLPLPGAFQVENALVAAGLVLATEGEARAEEVLRGLSSLRGVPGRLERVGEVGGALCIVDYAHKPDALAHVLAALRPFTSGRLICVFGCGGDRDRGKRPLMGRIAVEKADIAIVTDDNPRSEDPAAIRAEILQGASGAREIGDRAEAIRTAVRDLRPGDVLVVAGKGHETGQIIGDRTLPFSDHDEVRAAIAERRA
jgi:UDP-N-acetylmuramoyl-L-alanyl-D-glutamate--2,6-diaminopimelate ligase